MPLQFGTHRARAVRLMNASVDTQAFEWVQVREMKWRRTLLQGERDKYTTHSSLKNILTLLNSVLCDTEVCGDQRLLWRVGPISVMCLIPLGTIFFLI